MATPKSPVWARDSHTAVKHDLIRRYLQAWTPIVLQKFPRVTYAEGFAGPGVYTKGEPGSPVVALEVFLGCRELLDAQDKHLTMILVDEDVTRIESLREQVSKSIACHGLAMPRNLHVQIVSGTCSEALPRELSKANSFGQPIFAFLDSFGGPDIPFELLRAIASNKSSEVLVTFGTNFLTRFGEIEIHGDAGDRAFGGTRWRGVNSQQPGKKKAFLVNAYRETLKSAGFSHSLTFEMIDETSHAIFLIYGTNSLTGLAKMKDALWKADPLAGVSYRDPRDENQTLLDLHPDPDKSLLGRELWTQVGEKSMTIESLRQYTLLETIYRPEHVIPTVRKLITSGKLETIPIHSRVVKSTTIQRSRCDRSQIISDTHSAVVTLF